MKTPVTSMSFRINVQCFQLLTHVTTRLGRHILVGFRNEHCVF